MSVDEIRRKVGLKGILPLRFVGLALVLLSIGMALATIVRVLRWQSGRLVEVLDTTT